MAGLEGILRLAYFGDPAEFWVPVEGREAVQTNHFFGRRFFPAAAARTPEPARIDIPKPEVVYRIFVVGGSAAMGLPEPGFSFGIILEILLALPGDQLRSRQRRHDGDQFARRSANCARFGEI